MYRIVKRIVHTVTTVTWIVRLAGNSVDGEPHEKEITFPASHSFTEEEVSDATDTPENIDQTIHPNLDEGEKS